jgi:glyoxylase-like metal-dependent hydrolase (beta-lactamase superfamily II)
MPSRKLGKFTLHTLDGGLVRLDGGAMFGVVPKPMWERRIPPDDVNRIPLAMRCLLVETPDALVLIDNAVGNKENQKFLDIYGIENQGVRTRLEESLKTAGFSVDDVDIMIDTHLHFDHAGGNTVRDEDGQVSLTFQRAEYIVQRGEFEWAHKKNERTQASYFAHNFDPVQEAGRFRFVDGPADIIPGIRVVPTPGHTPHHQSVVITSEDETACFLADVVPTSAHLPLPWIMGYDVEPLVTLESKRSLLAQARTEKWLLVFEHDPVVAWGYLNEDEKRPRVDPV